MTAGGEIIITARKYRTQEQNRLDARARLAELVAKAHLRPAKRKKTRPSRAAKAKRMETKSARSAVKAARGKVRLD
jgi:ribosome-associated protein